MKQKIQITGKNVGELFALPCVKSVVKNGKAPGGFVVNLFPFDQSGDKEYERDRKEFIDRFLGSNCCMDDDTCRKLTTAFSRKYAVFATVGDWLVEHEDGKWRVECGSDWVYRCQEEAANSLFGDW